MNKQSTSTKRSVKRIFCSILCTVLAFAMIFGMCACAAAKTPEEYFQKVEKKSFASGIETILSSYQRNLDVMDSGKSAAKATVKISLGDDLIDMLEGLSDMDLSWISELMLSISSNVREEGVDAEFSLSLAKKALAAVNVLASFDEEAFYISVPDYADGTVTLDMNMLGEDVADTIKQLGGSVDAFENLPEAKELETILNKYIGIALSNIAEAKKFEDTLEIGGYEQNCTAVETEISMITVADILTDVITEMVKDEALDKLIEKFDDYFANMNMDIELADFWDEAKDGAKDILDEIEDEYENLDDETVLTWTTYVNSKSEVIGRHLEFEESDDEFFHGKAYEGKEFGYELYFKLYGEEILSIEGEGTDKNGVIDGSFEINTNGEELATVDVTGFDSNKAKEGYINGSFEISLGKALMSELELDYMMAGLFGSAFSIRIDMESSKNNAEMTIAVIVGKSEYASITVTGEQVKSNEIKVPTKNVTDDIEKWAGSFDFDALVDNLADAGVPDDITDVISLYTAFADFSGDVMEDVYYSVE